MTQDSIGFYEEPANGDGIIRCRTTGQLRCWDAPRTHKALERFNAETGRAEFPGIYLLLAGRKVYVGEAGNLYNRVKTHMNAPDEKIMGWTRVVLINDGRLASQSEFNDTVVRRALELYLGKLFKRNQYSVVSAPSQTESQGLTATQGCAVGALTAELTFLMKKKNFITKELEKHGQEIVYQDELIKMLEKAGKKVSDRGAYEIVIDGQKAFIRHGSNKPKGWQITFRDVFKDNLDKGEGFLIVNRGGVLLIPLSDVKKVIDANAFKQNTIDIWLRFEDDKVTLSYKDKVIDVSRFKLANK